MPTRSRKETLRYKKALKIAGSELCVFCNLQNEPENVVFVSKNFNVIRAKFPYSYWDQQGVQEHLMITPKRHVYGLNELNAHESVEFMNLMSSYEHKGFNVYARAPNDRSKSVPHQHTHLIRPLSKTSARFVFFIKKPYIRISK